MEYTQRINNLQAGISKFLKSLDFDSETTQNIRNTLKNLETSDIYDRLACIEKQIKENKVNLRNIKNETYIAEIFESYLYEGESKLKQQIDKKTEAAKIYRNEVKKEMQSVINKNNDFKKEIKRMEKEIDEMLVRNNK